MLSSAANDQLTWPIAKLSREATSYVNNRIYRNLGGTPFVIGTLRLSRLPFDPKLIQRLASHSYKTIRACKYGSAG